MKNKLSSKEIDDRVTELFKLANSLSSNNTSKKIEILVGYSKPSDLIVGKKFWYRSTNDNGNFHLLTITYIRSGIMFFTSTENNKEDYAPVNCYFSSRLEPEIFETDLSPTLFNVSSKYGKTKIVNTIHHIKIQENEQR